MSEIKASENHDEKQTMAGSLFSFQGRVGRVKYWVTIIPLFLISFAITIVMALATDRGGSGGFAILALFFYVPAIWIVLATYVKRWHDLGKSGWMTLTLLIPYVNLLILLILGLWPGTSESNKYGEVPQ